MKGRANQLHRLVKHSFDLFKGYTKSETLASQCEKHDIIKILNNLEFNQLKLNPSPKPKGIGIRNILLYDTLRITVYQMPKGEVMKLHNHPEMEVINYILRGKMEAKVYTPLLNNIYKKETHVLEPKHVSFIDGLLTKENNLHQFTALQHTHFMDIIFPDYDETRTCKHYEEDPGMTHTPQRTILREIKVDIDFFQI